MLFEILQCYLCLLSCYILYYVFTKKPEPIKMCSVSKNGNSQNFCRKKTDVSFVFYTRLHPLKCSQITLWQHKNSTTCLIKLSWILFPVLKKKIQAKRRQSFGQTQKQTVSSDFYSSASVNAIDCEGEDK